MNARTLQSPPGAKKVLFLITKATWGGAQRYVYDMATNLPREDFVPVVAYGEAGRLKSMLAHADIALRQIPAMRRDMGVISDVMSFFQVLRCIGSEKPDVVHLNSSKAAGLGALAARFGGVKRIVFTVHGWPFNEERSSLARALIYLASWVTALLAHEVIVVSKRDETQGQHMWLVAKKITYVPIGIEPRYLHPRDDAWEFVRSHVTLPPAASKWPRIVSIAELTRNKGLRYSIEAIALLKKTGMDALYVVIGDGEERGRLEQLAEKLEVSDRIVFAGFISDAALFLKAFDLFVLPSVKEGMPYVLLEAASAGLPVVTTDAVNPEFAGRYDHIRIVPSGDAHVLADAIITEGRLADQRELFPSSTPYSRRDMLAATLKLY